MLKKIILIIFFVFLSKYSYSNEKQKIIQKLEETKNLKFDFIQTLDKSVETGNCILEFSNKFLCHYNEVKKKILIENNILYLVDEFNNKSSQNITGTPFLLLVNKNEMINILKDIEDFKISNNRISIRINFLLNESIDLFFDNETYLISGWKVNNYDGSSLEFNLKNLLSNLKNIDNFFLN